jgi:hypothetical protein
MSSAIAKSAPNGDAAEIGNANHEANSVRWVGRWCQKWENENCPIGVTLVIATSDMNPTKPPSSASVGEAPDRPMYPGNGVSGRARLEGVGAVLSAS